MTNGYTLKTGRATRPDRSFPILAEGLLRAGDADGAAELCRRGLVHYPDNITGYALLAEAFLQLGQPTRALNVLEDGYRRTGADGLRSMAAQLEEGEREDARPDDDLLVAAADPAVEERRADEEIEDEVTDEEEWDLSADDEREKEGDAIDDDITGDDDDEEEKRVVTPPTLPHPLFEEEQADRGRVSLFDGTEMSEESVPDPESPPSLDVPPRSERRVAAPKPVDPELETPLPYLPQQSDAAAKIPSAEVSSLLLPTASNALSEALSQAAAEIEQAEEIETTERVEPTVGRNVPREAGLIAEDAPFMVEIAQRSPEPIIAEETSHARDADADATETDAIGADDADDTASLWGEERPDAEEVYFADAGSEFSILDMAVEEIGLFMEEPQDRRGREKDAARTEEERDPVKEAPSSSEPTAPFTLSEEPASTDARQIPSSFMQETPEHVVPPRVPEKTESTTARSAAPPAEPPATTAGATVAAAASGTSDASATRATESGETTPQPADARPATGAAAAPSDPPPSPRPLSIHSGTQISRLRSSNLRLIPGLEFAPLRRDEPGVRISPLVTGTGREKEDVTEAPAPPPPAATVPPPQRERRRDNPYLPGTASDEESMTPLEELARRLETARIPIVAEEGTHEPPAFEPSIVSETFAAILAEQGAYAEAIKAYQMLAFLKPEQRAAYEVKIEEMRWKLTSIVDERPPEEE